MELSYVVRSTAIAPDGRVTYTLVDLAGKVFHVTIVRELTTTELATPILTYVTESRRVLARSMS